MNNGINQKIQQECLKHSIPCNASWQSWLFQQGHLHGNINNDTDITRWSFDTRVLVKGGNYGRRRPEVTLDCLESTGNPTI